MRIRVLLFSLLLLPDFMCHGVASQDYDAADVKGQESVYSPPSSSSSSSSSSSTSSTSSSSSSVTFDTKWNIPGSLRVAHDTKTECIDSVVLLGVGTGMCVASYDDLLRQSVSVSPTMAVAMIDHRPGNAIKHAWWQDDRDPRRKFAALVNHLHKTQMEGLVPVCQGTKVHYFIGGHSSSGLTALEVIDFKLLDFVPAGYVGLDPLLSRLPIGNPWDGFGTRPLDMPVMLWGNSKQTCFVRVNSGAKFLYDQITTKCRALYQIQIPNSNTVLPGRRGHCDFTEFGCAAVGKWFGACPLSRYRNDATKSMTANSLSKFVEAIKASCGAQSFQLDKEPIQIRTCVNHDPCL